MKKFIVIFALMLITFMSNAQYINPNIRQDNTSPAQWSEWKGLMSQYNKGKGAYLWRSCGIRSWCHYSRNFA